MTRIERAIIIRDALVAWLPHRGGPRTHGPLRVIEATAGRFLILYRTPFSGALPKLVATNCREAQLLQRFGQPNLHYGLDVWADLKKVMNVEWDLRGQVDLVAFRCSGWEDELLSRIRPMRRRF
jgi:hypothetical protein